MADIIIDIASEFTGQKAFKKAEDSTEKLMKSVKKLAKTLGVAYGSQQILAFGKASIKAAAEDQKAQQQLALALKNVGLGRDAATSETYIQNLQSEFGIVDDLLRPAYQTLAVATRDTAEAQKLLNLSLDISASTGKDLGTVTAALSKAYLGNNTSLSKLGVGISKADLKAKSFENIVSQLSTTFKGSATAAANTFQGSIDKLGVASANVKEIIGTGLIDALTTLGKDTSVSDLAADMEKTATYLADVIRGIGVLGDKLKNTPIIGQVFGNLNVGMIPIVGTYLELLRKAGTSTAELKASDNQHLKSLESQFKVSTKIVNNSKKLTAAEQATLKAKKLQTAIDKANLILGKAGDVFDLDQIQIAAALTNQAEQLAKTTSGAQALQIANDTARLNVKRSILELEKAIAAGDEEAIKKATAKLNLDLSTLSALTGQEAKLKDIKSILDSLSNKSIGINVDTADALNKIKALYAAAASGIVIPVSLSGAAATGTTTTGTTGAVDIGGLYTAIGSNLKEYLVQSGLLTSGVSPNGKEFNYSITVNAGIGDPNAIANTIVQFLNAAKANGTLANGILNSQ